MFNALIAPHRGTVDQSLHNKNLTALSLKVTRWLSLAVIVFTVLTFIAYIFEIELLASAHGIFPPMRFGSAIALFLLALSTVLTPRSKIQSFVVFIAGIFCITLGSFTLAENFLPFPGTPTSPQAAFNFILMGCSLIIYYLFPYFIRFAQYMLLFAAINAEIALVGYIFNATEVFGFPIYHRGLGMSVQTAVCFVLLSVSLFCSRPGIGITKLLFREKSASGAVARKLFLTVIFGPLVIGIITHIGLYLGLYNDHAHDALFVLLFVAVIIRNTWQSAKHSEIQELHLEKILEEKNLSEAKSSGIISISADAIISINRDQDIVLFNGGAEKIFGYSSAEALGQKLDFLMPKRFRKNHHHHVNDFSKGENAARRMGERGTTIYGLRKNGEEFPADAAISKIDVNGSQLMTVTLRDITDQLRLEKGNQLLSEVGAALAESGLILEKTIQKLAEVSVKSLGDYCILNIVRDKEESDILKIVAKDPGNTRQCENILSLIQSGAFAHLIVKAQESLLIENITDYQLSLLSSNEAELKMLLDLNLVSLLSVPLIAKQKFIGTLVIISTTKNHKYHDFDLKLASGVALRAALSIENSHLYNESKKAISSREEILAVVSHDLKSPLTTVKLIGETLQLLEFPDKKTCESLAKKIGKSARQMEVLIGDLLDFAKIQSGAFSVNQTTEYLYEALRETTESLQAQAESNQQSLVLDFNSDLPRVNIDLPRISQVILNLLGNALKFTPAGGTIKVTAEVRDADVLVSVSDTGPGIPPEYLTKVFDRFWQVEGTKHKGSGLGLSIAKGIVLAHGGKIWAESELNKGTTFYFTVPVAGSTAAEQSSRPNTLAIAPPGATANSLQGTHILVVDDSPDNLFLIKYLLESMGAKVTVAENVKSALSSIKFSLPNVLFTDIDMPEESGYDLLSQLRMSSDSKNKTIPVIALTGHGAEKEINKIKDAGFDLCLAKPINLEKMVSAILKFTNH